MVAISVDYETAFKNVGLDFQPLVAAGIKVAMSTNGMKFAKDGEVLATLPLAPGKVSELAQGFDPKNQSHQTAKATLTNTFKKLAGGQAIPAAKPPGHFAPPAAAQPAPAPVAAPLPADIKTFPPDQMGNAPMISLLQATQLFQPVKGTSQGSRYFVVGLGAGIKVAARYKGDNENGKLSVRIEGEAFPKLTMKIQEAGVFGPSFAGTFDQKYASMHVAVAGKKEAQRVIGAVLGSMAPFIGHACPDIEPLMKVAA
jgi:hypothetical protein